MAFVYKSERSIGKENSPKNELGPGQYLPQGSNRNLKPIKYPFYSATFRETNTKKEEVPGPGSYEYDDKYEKIASMLLDKSDKCTSFLKSLEIAGAENLDPFSLMINKENQKDVGFLTKEKRFKEPVALINENPGPGKYQKHEPVLAVVNSLKTKKKKIPKIAEKGKLCLIRYERSPNSPNRVATIPSKILSYGYDIAENGELIMKEDPEKHLKYGGEFNDTVGPGSYDIVKNKQWFKNMVSWDKISRTSRDPHLRKDNLASEELLNSTIVRDRGNITMMDVNNLNKSISNNINPNNTSIQIRNSGNLKSSLNNINSTIVNPISGKNDIIIYKEKKREEKEKVFKHFRDKRQKLLEMKTLKSGVEDELLNKHVIYQEPGPGYYNAELVTSAFKNQRLPEKFQTFGSSSLRFQENSVYDIGPGSYFKDDQRLEKKKLKQYLNEKVNFSANQMHVREDLKKERLQNYENRLGINGLINKHKLRSDGSSPGPGWYETIGNNFQKKTISNCGQFGSIQKRFTEENFNYEIPGPGSYLGIPKSQTATISGTLHKLLVKPKKIKTDDEKNKPDLTLFPKNDEDEEIKNEKNKIPSVGQYNSDILFSLGYKVAKNVNKFNGISIPFNSVEKRFLSYTKRTAAGTIGPGQYHRDNSLNNMRNTVSHSPPFNTSADKKGGNPLYNLYTVGNTGPGSYNVSSYFDWNKKSYNIQYI